MKGKTLGRFVVAQAQVGIDALGGPDREAGVHEARKACKRARAALELAPGTRRLRARYRDAARVLSEVRDADVLRHTLADLGAETELPSVDEGDAWRRVGIALERLTRARDRTSRHRWKRVRQGAIRKRHAGAWDEARDAMAMAATARDGHSVHEWRKTVKRLYYQLQILEASVEVLERADALQELLGHHHDLHVAAGWIPGRASELEEKAEHVLNEALGLGWMLFEPPPPAGDAHLGSDAVAVSPGPTPDP